jgi:hypothetical protein
MAVFCVFAVYHPQKYVYVCARVTRATPLAYPIAVCLPMFCGPIQKVTYCFCCVLFVEISSVAVLYFLAGLIWICVYGSCPGHIPEAMLYSP